MFNGAAAEIMLVDDTPANLRLLDNLLCQQGYRVRPASSGSLALRSAAAKPPDLILLDVRMPEMDGHTVCERLKSDPHTQSIPVIFISASNDTADKVKGFAVGGVDYVTKPFEPAEVLARVNTHLELKRLREGLERLAEARAIDLVKTHRALDASEKRLRLVIEATSDGVWDWNVRTEEMFFSDRWYTMLGYEPGEFPAGYSAWRDRVHPDDLESAEAVVRAHLANLVPEINVEARLRAKSGLWKWINSRGKAIEREADGSALRLVGTNTDVTARKESEAALRENSIFLNTLLNAIPAPVFYKDTNGHYLGCNQAFAESIGQTRSDVVGKTASELMPTQEAETHRVMDLELLGQPRPAAYEGQTTDPAGSIHDVVFHKAVFLNSDNCVAGIIGVILDISERKEAERALRISEAFYRSVFENSLFGIGIADPDMRLIQVNPAFCRMVGYESDEIINRMRLSDLTHPDDREIDVADMRRLINREQEDFVAERRCIGKSGEVIDVIAFVRAIRSDTGAYVGSSTTVLDITTRKQAEAELERHREKLQELVAERTAELRHAMQQLVQAEKLAALGHLVAGVAHELNTPLGNVRMMSTALVEEVRAFGHSVDSGALRRSQVSSFQTRCSEAVDLIERNAIRAADLIGHFKEVAVDQTSARRRRFALRETIDEMLTTLQPQFKRTAHRIELDIPSGLEMDSYPGPLEQVLCNLINNSLTHGFARMDAGTIRIRAEPADPGNVRIDYTDDGTGIPEALYNRIFEPFFTPRLGSGGSGLGLYITYNLVTAVLGGTITVCPPQERGIRFSIILPRSPAAQPISGASK